VNVVIKIPTQDRYRSEQKKLLCDCLYNGDVSLVEDQSL
jgi:hypothetical protein